MSKAHRAKGNRSRRRAHAARPLSEGSLEACYFSTEFI